MTVTGIRELKNKLSEYLRLVRDGEAVLITDRGRVIAQITPPPAYLDGAGDSEQAALARLARAARVRLGVGEFASLNEPELDVDIPAGEAADALDDVRSERFGG